MLKKACRYIFPRLFVVLALRSIVHNGFIFVCWGAQSPICHLRKMAAETRESFILIFLNYSVAVPVFWALNMPKFL